MTNYLEVIPSKIATDFRLLKDRSKAQKRLPKDQISPIVAYNRNTLRKVSQWIDEDVYQKSLFQYGLPETVRHLIDNPLGDEITYSDAMLYLSQFLKKKIEYLEIGVSVGKNFFQVMNFLKGSSMTGFDIEEINPVLERFLTLQEKSEWTTRSQSLKQSNSSLKQYEFSQNRNSVRYISGDVYDESCWQRLSGYKFNIIFSDALHSADALLYEWEMIKKYELLDADEFLMVWDDLGGEMERAFDQIWADVAKTYGLGSQDRLRVKLNGWIGLKQHQVGFISKLG